MSSSASATVGGDIRETATVIPALRGIELKDLSLRPLQARGTYFRMVSELADATFSIDALKPGPESDVFFETLNVAIAGTRIVLFRFDSANCFGQWLSAGWVGHQLGVEIVELFSWNLASM